jgi:hypothetical protein
LYELKTGSDEFACFVKCVLKLMEVEYLTIVLDPTNKQDLVKIEGLKKKTPLGKFPVLQL